MNDRAVILSDLLILDIFFSCHYIVRVEIHVRTLDGESKLFSSMDKFEREYKSGKVPSNALYWKSGMPDWKPVREVQWSRPPLSAYLQRPNPTTLIVVTWGLVLASFLPFPLVIAFLCSLGILGCSIALLFTRNKAGIINGLVVLGLWIITFLISFMITFAQAYGDAAG